MNIFTFTTEEYRGCPIYFRNFRDHFEYLVVINKEIYTAHICVRPHWLTKLFFKLDISTKVDKLPYSQQQLANILRTLRKMSETTIDLILDKK